MAEDWTREEVEIIVAECFEMLQKEQAGISYGKTETRQRTLPLLKNRSNGSVEFKNRNISAVLVPASFAFYDNRANDYDQTKLGDLLLGQGPSSYSTDGSDGSSAKQFLYNKILTTENPEERQYYEEQLQEILDR